MWKCVTFGQNQDVSVSSDCTKQSYPVAHRNGGCVNPACWVDSKWGWLSTDVKLFTLININPIYCCFLSSTTHRWCPAPDSSDRLWSANVSGTTFCVYWSRQFQTNQTYCIALKKGSEVIQFWETNQTMMTVTGLQPGVLYNVSVKPCACGSNGTALYILVKTGKNWLFQHVLMCVNK